MPEETPTHVVRISDTLSLSAGDPFFELAQEMNERIACRARELINAVSVAIAASTREPPSPTTAMLARIIVSEARKRHPNNLLLQSIDLDGKVPDWNDIRGAMKVAIRTLGESTGSD